MAELKTKPSLINPVDFLKKHTRGQVYNDCIIILSMMKKITNEEPKMWGTSIIGYGNIHLKYESGRELDWFKIGFSPRKQNISLYVLSQNKEQDKLLSKLGKYKAGKGCLYIKAVNDIDLKVLEELIKLCCKKFNK